MMNMDRTFAFFTAIHRKMLLGVVGVLLSIGLLQAPCWALPAHSPGQTTSVAIVQKDNSPYIHWEDLPPGPLKTAFEETGSNLINNLNIVKLEDGKPVLIRGGGYTPANLDWLVLKMGVRTIIDLRGHFSDDKTNQFIIHSPLLLKQYQENNEVNKLRNLSPTGVQQYLEALGKKHAITVHYVHMKAENPKIISYLNSASPSQPLAMFCQWGTNRSGTAWGEYAAVHGWPFERALKFFGVKKQDGSYRNRRDIAYGYRLEHK